MLNGKNSVKKINKNFTQIDVKRQKSSKKNNKNFTQIDVKR